MGDQVTPIIDLMAISNAHFAKLRDFITLRLPPGFPVKIGEKATKGQPELGHDALLGLGVTAGGKQLKPGSSPLRDSPLPRAQRQNHLQ